MTMLMRNLHPTSLIAPLRNWDITVTPRPLPLTTTTWVIMMMVMMVRRRVMKIGVTPRP